MKPEGQMTLSLTKDLEQFVRDEVAEGAFASNSEYIRDLLRERYMQKRAVTAKLKALDEALARGIADAEAGRVVPIDKAFQRLRDQLNAGDASA